MSYRLHGKNHVGVDIKTFRERSRRSIGTPKSYFRSVAERSMKLQDRLLESLSARSDLVALVESRSAILMPGPSFPNRAFVGYQQS